MSSTPDSADFLLRHYDQLDHLLREHGPEIGVSEAHGLCCGLVTRAITDFSMEQWCELLAIAELSDAVLSALQGLHGLATRVLQNQESAFDLLLPDDETDVRVRAEALSEWCSGYLRSFLAGGRPELDETGDEAIDDIQAISNLEMDDDDLDDQERSLFEIQEYLRVAVQILYEQFNDDSNRVMVT